MAHGDYNCCAVCDCKMQYSYDATTKEQICTACLKALRTQGLSILDVDELKNWIKTEKPEIVKDVLSKIGYSKCCYGNEVDELVSGLS